MEWWIILLMLPAPVLFFFCCCAGYCGYFYDRVISLGNWTQEAGSWGVHADHYFYTTDDNAILLSNVDANTPENAIRVRIVLSSGDEARIYTTYTDANDHAYLKIIGGTSISYVETTGGTPVEYETFPENGNMPAATDITFRICYDDNTIAVNHSSASPQNLFYSTKTVAGKFGFGTGTISGTVKFYRVVETHINGIGAYDPDVAQISTAEGSDCIACSLCEKVCSDSTLPSTIELAIDENAWISGGTTSELPCAAEPIYDTYVLTRVTEPVDLDGHCLSNYQYSPCTYHLQVEIPCEDTGYPFEYCTSGLIVDLLVTFKAFANSDTYTATAYILTRHVGGGQPCRAQYVYHIAPLGSVSEGGAICLAGIEAIAKEDGTAAWTWNCGGAAGYPWAPDWTNPSYITVTL